MNNGEIKEIALKQSAEDIGCQAHDFLSDKNVIFEDSDIAAQILDTKA